MRSNRAQAAAIRPTKAEQPLGALAKCQAASRRLLYERPVAVLLVLFLTAVTVIIWHTENDRSIMVEAQALLGLSRPWIPLCRRAPKRLVRSAGVWRQYLKGFSKES